VTSCRTCSHNVHNHQTYGRHRAVCYDCVGANLRATQSNWCPEGCLGTWEEVLCESTL